MTYLNNSCWNCNCTVEVCNLTRFPDRFDFVFPALSWIKKWRCNVGDLRNAPFHGCECVVALRIAETARLEHKSIAGITGRPDVSHSRRVRHAGILKVSIKGPVACWKNIGL